MSLYDFAAIVTEVTEVQEWADGWIEFLDYIQDWYTLHFQVDGSVNLKERDVLKLKVVKQSFEALVLWV